MLQSRDVVLFLQWKDFKGICMIDFQKLVKAGVHFGHQTSRWNPKMAPYIWGFKNKVHLIDVSKTAYQLERAAKFLESVTADGKTVLWVGTKKPAQPAIEAVAAISGMPYVKNRWVGGTLSNFGQVKKAVTKLLHYEDILSKSEQFPHYTKKEFNVFKKTAERLEKSVGGIRMLKWPIGAIVIVDVGKEFSALKEAEMMGVPVVAVVDTNCDPSRVDYVIPANDDAEQSIRVVLDYLGDAVVRGKEAARNRGVEEQEALATAEATMMPDQEEGTSEERTRASQARAKSSGSRRPPVHKRSPRPAAVEERKATEETAPAPSSTDDTSA